MSYWDTSTLGKLYFLESDSALLAQAGSPKVIITAKLQSAPPW